MPAAQRQPGLGLIGQLHVGAGMRCEIRPVLSAADVRGFSLATLEQAGGARLGGNTYLQQGPSGRERDGTMYQLHS